jgi:MOSC domain-containing protein
VSPASPRHLAEIRVYPVKSLGGGSVAEADVEPWGLRHDRRFVVVEQDGTVLTAREEHELLAFGVSPAGDGGVEVTAPDGARLRVPAPRDGAELPVSLSRLDCVRSAGAAADEWLSSRLGRPVRLGFLDDPRRRPVSEAHGGRPGDVLNLSDAGPLLLTTRASLRQLDEWAAEGAAARGEAAPAALSMTRFRPSVVVDGPDPPFAEDGWTTVRIGGVEFRFGEHCDRCALTTIDPETRLAGKEPLRTLARHRRWSRKTWFGIRIIPLGTGRIRVGDEIEIVG